MQKMACRHQGFTLVEVLITMVIAMVILGGLLLNFMSQSRQYAYQDKRGDAMQDLELALRYIAHDIQNSLCTSNSDTEDAQCSINYDGGLGVSTSYVSMQVWDEDPYTYTNRGLTVPDDRQATRCYIYRATGAAATRQQIYVNRHHPSCASGISIQGFDVLIGEPVSALHGMPVTHFRVFHDGFWGANISAAPQPAVGSRSAYNGTAGSGYIDLPPRLPPKWVKDADDNQNLIPAFTILIEMEVDAAYPGGALTDVMGNPLPAGSKKRIWRYMQVYPSILMVN